MRFIKNTLLLCIFGYAGFFLYGQKDAIKDFAQQNINRFIPCSYPLTYSLGRIDERFQLKETDILKHLEESENLWETSAGNMSTICTAFTYSEWSACTDGKQTRSSSNPIPTGCIGGDPILSRTCTSGATQCTDNDSGKEYFLKGFIKDTDTSNIPGGVIYDQCSIKSTADNPSGNYMSTNSCFGENCYLSEMYCSSNTEHSMDPYHCPNGCTDGACNTDTTGSCLDLQVSSVPARNDAFVVICSGDTATKRVDVDVFYPDGTLFKDFNGQGSSANASISFVPSDPKGTYTVKCFVNGQTKTTNACKKAMINPESQSGGNDGNICGNGITETAEECDDGNTNTSDSCSNSCKRSLSTMYKPKYICTDTDNGANYFSQGGIRNDETKNMTNGVLSDECSVKNIQNSFDTVESCTSGNCFVREGFCSSTNYYSTEYHTCENGCSQGACLRAPMNCSSFSYNEWGECQNGEQTRTVRFSGPEGCTGGDPFLVKSC